MMSRTKPYGVHVEKSHSCDNSNERLDFSKAEENPGQARPLSDLIVIT